MSCLRYRPISQTMSHSVSQPYTRWNRPLTGSVEIRRAGLGQILLSCTLALSLYAYRQCTCGGRSNRVFSVVADYGSVSGLERYVCFYGHSDRFSQSNSGERRGWVGMRYGFTTVTPRQVKPCCISSDNRILQRFSAVIASISASQICRL